MERFSKINFFDTRKDFEKVVSGILYLIKIANTNGNRLVYDEQSIIQKIARGKNMYDVDINYKRFIISLFEDDDPPNQLFSSLLFTMYKNNVGYPDEYIIPYKENERLRLKYLSSYFNRIDEIDSDDFWPLFNSCQEVNRVDLGNGSFRVEQKYSEKAIIMLKRFLTLKSTNGFLIKVLRQNHFGENGYSIDKSVVQIFGSYDNFLIFLKELQDIKLDKSLDEFIAFSKN